jgi:ABC-type branched-subunit amino acid transport system ATPase component
MPDVIVTRQLTKYYDRRPVVHGLDLRVPRGSVYGLLGRNASGKSTTIKMLLGMVHPDFGTAELFGEDSSRLRPETRSRIAYLAEGHPLYRWMTVGEAVRFTRAFYPSWNDTLIEQILDHFGLSRRAKIRRLSNGQRAQVSLALAVAAEPELLILDDPTLGLDTVWIALLGILVHGYFVLGLMNVKLMTGRVGWRGTVPFVTDNYLSSFAIVAVAVAGGLGFQQTLTESARGTWLFLLHRPAPRRKLLAMKLFMGIGSCLLTSAVPVLVYGWWAATPGTHASPFEWSMTLWFWQGLISVTGVYLAAFLSGIRPARWFGTRLAPLVGAGLILVGIQFLPNWWVFGLGAILLVDARLVGTILSVVRTRDYS